MNEPRSTRYHRALRRAGAGAAALNAVILAALLLTPASRALRDAAAGSVIAYALLLLPVLGAAAFPLEWYRYYVLPRDYELSGAAAGRWLREHLLSGLIRLAAGTILLSAVYALIELFPGWWWIPAAFGGIVLVAIVTVAAPVLILPRRGRTHPLERESLRDRISSLAARAGIQAPRVQEWRTSGRSRAAAAALVGAGFTRRIVLSDTLLADYSDDEIEAVLAHEMGHHVHGDVLKGMLAECLLIALRCAAPAGALTVFWRALGLSSPADPAGIPLLLLVSGAVTLAARPVLNAVSRRNERRADEYAVSLCSRPDAFVTAMRRMAAQNLVDESPSRAAFLLCHTHPLVEDRIALAREGARPGPRAAPPTLHDEAPAERRR